MKIFHNKYYLHNFVFLACLATLLVNDHFLKFHLSNWLTGKLSDAAGIIMLPLLLIFLFPKLKLHAVWLSAALFMFWKSAFSQPYIDFYNKFSPVQTSRVVDPTDLIVLFLLPVPFLIIDKPHFRNSLKFRRVPTPLILLPTIIGLLATSPPPWYHYTRSEGNLICNNCHIEVDYSQKQIIAQLGDIGIVFDKIRPMDATDMAWNVNTAQKESINFCRLDKLIIDSDTLRQLDFTLRTTESGTTEIYFNGMQVSEDVSDRKLARKLITYYEKIIFSRLKTGLR